MKKILATLYLLCFVNAFIFGAYKGCPDFTELNASHVSPFASKIGNVLVEGRHTVMNDKGTDPLTGDKMQIIPDGYDKVVRLGNKLCGAERESLTYSIIPTDEECIFKLKFAVVFENPGHPIEAQPYFSISITDKNGIALPNLLSYYVYAKKGLDKFQENRDSGYDCIMWRDWSDVILDLSSYIGQELHIVLETKDCTYGGHFSYAYFCGSAITTLAESKCSGEKSSISIIDGFKSYLWSDGSTSRTYEGSLDQPVWCDATSFIGDVTRIYMFQKDGMDTTPEVVTDSICECDDYQWKGIKIDTHFQGKRRFTGVEVDKKSCTTKNNYLYLTATPIYYTIKDAICEGEDYNDNGFDVKNPPKGMYKDTIEVTPYNKCRRFNVLNLNVVPSSISSIIEGEDTPCANTIHTYKVPGNYHCEWSLPDNMEYKNINGTNADSIDVIFVNDKQSVLSVTCSNGCATSTATKTLNPFPMTRTYTVDTICQGTEYKKDSWDLGVQNKTGYSTHIRVHDDPCGSTDVLVLYVKEQSSVKIMGDSIVCKGNPVQLHSSFYNPNSEDNDIVTGDVFCTDGSVLGLDEFLKSGKEAIGVVAEALPYGNNGFFNCIVFDIKDALQGDSVVLETAQQGDYMLFSDTPNYIMHYWDVLNKVLAQIKGADILDGLYWTSFQSTINGVKQQCAFGYGERNSEDSVIEKGLGLFSFDESRHVKCKIRNYSLLTIRKQ